MKLPSWAGFGPPIGYFVDYVNLIFALRWPDGARKSLFHPWQAPISANQPGSPINGTCNLEKTGFIPIFVSNIWEVAHLRIGWG